VLGHKCRRSFRHFRDIPFQTKTSARTSGGENIGKSRVCEKRNVIRSRGLKGGNTGNASARVSAPSRRCAGELGDLADGQRRRRRKELWVRH